MSNVGKKLKKFMIDMDLSAEDIKKVLDISKSAFYRKINGDSQFTLGEVRKIADTYDMSSEQVKDIFFSN